MASAPILYGFNLLEEGTVTVANESTAQPKERLFDRDIGLTYRSPASTATREIKVNKTGNAEPVTAWVVSSCHGFVGATLTLDSSPDGAAWTTRDTFAPTSCGAIRRSITSVTADWWRLQSTGTTGTIDIGEVLFTKAFTLPKIPAAHGPHHALLGNVARQESLGGHVWKARLGEERWEADWALHNVKTSDRDAVLDFFRDDLDGGSKFLYLTDPEGTTRWAEWVDAEARFEGKPINLWDVTLRFREVL